MRNFDSALIAALQQEVSERVYLIELEYSGGSLYLTTGSRDLLWDSQVWDSAGGALSLGAVEESGDMKGSGIDIMLSGVNQAITAILLAQQYRGRLVQVWQVLLDQTTGDVTDTVPLFDGLQLDSYEVEERVQRGKPLSCTIRTRARHRLSVAEFRGIRANLHAHQLHYPGDTFFKHVASFINRKIYWGTTAPVVPRTGGKPGGRGYDRGVGTGDEGKRGDERVT